MRIQGIITSFANAMERIGPPSAWLHYFTPFKGEGMSIPLKSVTINEEYPGDSFGIMEDGTRLNTGDEITIEITKP